MRAGKRIKKWREALGLTQRQAAKVVGVSQPTFGNYENDIIVDVRLDTALAFVAACGGEVRLEDFAEPKKKRAS